MKLKSSILQIPLDLEMRSASTKKYYFLHFPYLQLPKVFALPSLNYTRPLCCGATWLPM